MGEGKVKLLIPAGSEAEVNVRYTGVVSRGSVALISSHDPLAPMEPGFQHLFSEPWGLG